MAKRLVILGVLFLACSGVSYAAPAYGTHMPEKGHWTWGLEGDFLVDRDLADDQGSTNGSRYFLTGSLGIFDWLCFDGKVGIGNVEWDRVGASDLDYETNFAGGYGFRIKGYENEKWGIKTVVGFQHISVHPLGADEGIDKHQVIIDDWQGSLLVSKDIGSFVPYCGARYGSVDFIKWVNEHDRKRIKSDDFLGLVLGADYWIDSNTKVNLEGAFIDGQEYAIGISRDF
ncbi:MAG: hypothetical protein WC569_01425 [Candidatus Omnitrophota bacterium]